MSVSTALSEAVKLNFNINFNDRKIGIRLWRFRYAHGRNALSGDDHLAAWRL